VGVLFGFDKKYELEVDFSSTKGYNKQMSMTKGDVER